MEPEPGAEPLRRRADAVRTGDGNIVIQFPRIDPNLRDFLWEMIPGRAILRVLSDLPEEVLVHSRNARRERLLALRALLDGMIEEMERPAPRPRAREVEIE
jgi:hypothetical protein